MFKSAIGELAARVWDKISIALTILGLIDVTGQVIKWAALVHRLAEIYGNWRDWLFRFLPFQVPPEWHNFVVIGAIIFSVTNIGFYRRTGKIFALQLIFILFLIVAAVTQFLPWLPEGPKLLTSKGHVEPPSAAATIDDAALLITEICLPAGLLLIGTLPIIYVAFLTINVELTYLFYVGEIIGMICVTIGTGVLIAWRWIIGTSLVFSVLIAVNEIYIHCLIPK
jgi:hypothetical protein